MNRAGNMGKSKRKITAKDTVKLKKAVEIAEVGLEVGCVGVLVAQFCLEKVREEEEKKEGRKKTN